MGANASENKVSPYQVCWLWECLTGTATEWQELIEILVTVEDMIEAHNLGQKKRGEKKRLTCVQWSLKPEGSTTQTREGELNCWIVEIEFHPIADPKAQPEKDGAFDFFNLGDLIEMDD